MHKGRVRDKGTGKGREVQPGTMEVWCLESRPMGLIECMPRRTRDRDQARDKDRDIKVDMERLDPKARLSGVWVLE
jgi:hypothetical protein